MRALLQRRFGNPAEVLEFIDLPDEPLGPGQVRIRVEATPIHAGDLRNIAGERTMVRHPTGGADLEVRLPQVPGVEGVGRVVERAPDVTDVDIGQRVFLPIQCGSWREAIVADAATLVNAPEGDAVQLSLMVNALTADMALRDIMPLKAGDWIAQNGANSNVGRILIPLARERGIRTVNIVRRPELVEELTAIGADIVLLDGDDLAARVAEATGGASIPLALDCVSGDATSRLAECLADDGTIANYGAMSGGPCKVEPWMLTYKRIRLIGYYMGYKRRARSIDEQRVIFGELADGIVAGKWSATIAGTYRLEDYVPAVEHAARGGRARDGKIVFTVG